MQGTTDRSGLGILWFGVVVVVAGVAAYANSFRGPFIFDDVDSIPGNPYIRHLWPLSNVLSAPEQTTAAGRPVVSLSLAINYAIGGLDVWGYHAFNLLIHLLSAVLLFGIVRRTLKRPTFGSQFARSGPWLAAAVSLLWTVHPLQTESVTYIIQRTELLMGMFYLLTLYCAIRGWGSPYRRLWLAAAVGACALGMGSKEAMASAPLVVVLYDGLFVSGSYAAALRRHGALYAGLAATWIILGVLLASGPRSETVGFGLGIGALDYLRTQAQVLVRYLRLCFWPAPLVIHYGWPVARTWGESALPGLVILSLLVGTIWALLRRHWTGFAGAWFFLILAPSSSFVPIVSEIAAERRMYLPLAAVVTLAVVAVQWGGDRACRWLGLRGPALRFAGAGLVIVLAGVCAYATGQRNLDYRTAVAIWRDAVDKQPANARVRTNLAGALIQAGQFDDAVQHCRVALDLEPGASPVHNALGEALAKQGESAEAVEQFRAALRFKPDYRQAHNNLAKALASLGREQEALEHFRRALDLWPDYVDAHVNLGGALARAGRVDEAIRHCQTALKLDPENVVCLNNLGDSLSRQGRTAEAIHCYREALRLDPDYHPAYNNLGNALTTLGRVEEAFEHFRRALALEPDYADAHVSFGYALARIGKLEEAIRHYRRALELEPRNVLCLNNLGSALLSQERVEAAIETFRQALAIDPQHAATHNNLANALVTAGDLSGGAACYARAIALAPDLLPAHYNLAETYRRMERVVEAKAQYRRALALAQAAGDAAIVERIRQELASLE